MFLLLVMWKFRYHQIKQNKNRNPCDINQNLWHVVKVQECRDAGNCTEMIDRLFWRYTVLESQSAVSVEGKGHRVRGLFWGSKNITVTGEPRGKCHTVMLVCQTGFQFSFVFHHSRSFKIAREAIAIFPGHNVSLVSDFSSFLLTTNHQGEDGVGGSACQKHSLHLVDTHCALFVFL